MSKMVEKQYVLSQSLYYKFMYKTKWDVYNKIHRSINRPNITRVIMNKLES